MAKPIIIALAKGRILQKILPLFAKIDIKPSTAIASSRQLLFSTNDPQLKFIIVRAIDVPNYVVQGAAHLGVVGKDVLMEASLAGYYELLDLKLASCRLMTAAPCGKFTEQLKRRVATKFPNIARQYYTQQGIQAEIIKLSGAMELAPLLNLADEIVDIVDTGYTLEANQLEARDLIAQVSARLIGNRASIIRDSERIKALIARLRNQLKSLETA